MLVFSNIYYKKKEKVATNYTNRHELKITPIQSANGRVFEIK